MLGHSCVFTIFFISTISPLLVSAAGLTPSQKYQEFLLDKKTSKPMKIKVQKTFDTTDSCNAFSAGGHFQAVQWPKEVSTLEQIFLANFTIMSTLMACEAGGTRRLTVESKPFEIEPINGYIRIRVLVPEGFELLLE
jgi:hypothetical protein